MKIVAVWENGFPTTASYFSFKKGIADGTAAYAYAEMTIHQPALTPIYFAVDYDASPSDATGPILEYFRGIVSAFNNMKGSSPGYFIGVYGSGLICRTLLDAGMVTYAWLAQSKGWRESSTFNHYNLKQLMQKMECSGNGGITGDPNESPNDKEGSFQISHLVDYIVRKNLITSNPVLKPMSSPLLATPITLEKIKSIVANNNNSPFTDNLIVSICWMESSFIENATNSSSSATGLMMMTKAAIDTVNKNTPSGTHFKHTEMTTADRAVAAGTWYLKVIYDHWGNRDKHKTLKNYGTGTDTYANKISASETCMQTSTNHMACLKKEIHP